MVPVTANMVLLTTRDRGPTGNGKLLLLCGLGLLLLAPLIVLTVCDPILYFTKRLMLVYNGSSVHEFLQKPMVSIDVSAYLFNITNAEDFLSGKDHKLKVEEVGPFTYSETRYNDDLELDVDAGVIRYKPRTELVFVPEKSVARPEDVMVTMPNLPMLGLTSRMSAFPYWTRMAFNVLTSQLNSKPIVTLDANTYLWGYKEPLISLANSMAPGLVHFDKIGILDRLFDKKFKNRLEVSALPENRFMINTQNGHKKLAMGSSDPDQCEICNDFINAYEGIGYPSDLSEDSPIRLYRVGLCRTLDMVFHKHVVYDGVPGLMYNLSDSFYSLDPNVTKNRKLDLTDCFFGLPVALSKVKFLDMDPEVYERVEGLTPDPSKNSYILLEQKISLEMYSYFPVQTNLLLEDMSFSPAAKPFSNMLLPIGYVEIIQPPLPEETVASLRLMYFSMPLLILFAKIICTLLSISVISYAVLLYRGKIKHTPLEKKLAISSAQEPLVKSDKTVIL